MRHVGGAILGCCIEVTLAFAVTFSALPLTAQNEPPRRGIDHHDRLLLVRARAEGKADACVLVVTTPGSVAKVIDEASALGAQVLTRFDDVGYLRVCLPVAAFARLRALPGVLDARIDTDGLSYGADQGTDDDAVKLAESATRVKSLDTTATRPPLLTGARLTAQSPLLPMGDMGAPQFTRRHPTYDGRGVTIAVLERGVLDLAHPALQVAKTLTGDSVRKIRGIITPWSYVAELSESQLSRTLAADYLQRSRRRRVQPTGPIDASTGSFTVEGWTYVAPAPGSYAFGYYAYPIGDRAYGVLWDHAHGTVWVDTDRDHDFRNETPLHDFNTSHETGSFHPVPFAVAFDSAGRSVFVYEGISAHQSMSASVAAGAHFLGGEANASAPGAQLLIVNAGRTVGEVIEGFIRAAGDPQVDLITCSFTSGSFPEAGESVVALVLDRVVRRYGKPIFASAGNSGPRLSLPMEPGNTPGVISVGGYISRETYRAHYGWVLDDPDWLAWYSARGPTVNGAMKPDVVAPALSIAAAACSEEPDRSAYLVYSLPRCYMLAGGTSSAAPHAAGAAALLISAAKQAHVPYDARHVAWALRTSARMLPGYGVNEQGGGLLDVGRAWALLQRTIELPEITTEAPVNTRLNPYLRIPGRGPGLYEREGWAPGDTGTRTITLTRTTGSPGRIRYSLRWRGNDGTFATATTVALPLSASVSVAIRIAPRTADVHSAALEVVDRASGEAVHQMLITIVAAYQLTAANGYTVHATVRAGWPRSASVFVNVPTNARALRVELSVKRGRLGLRAEDPATLDNLAGQSYWKGYLYPVENRYISPAHTGSQLFPAPTAGVWELSVGPIADPNPIFGGDSVQYREPGEAEIVASVLGAEAEQASLASAGGQPAGISLDLGFTNQFAPIGRAVASAELGVRRIVSGTIDSTEEGPAFDIEVDSGTTSLRVAAEPTVDTGADLDLYLYNCTTGHCHLWEVALIHGATSSLLVRAPAAGKWKVFIDPARLSAGETGFRFTEILTHPKYGHIEFTPTTVPRGTGEHWQAGGAVRLRDAAPSGTELVAVADLVDEAAEAAEQAHPLAVFGGPRYRPVAVGSSVVAVRR